MLLFGLIISKVYIRRCMYRPHRAKRTWCYDEKCAAAATFEFCRWRKWQAEAHTAHAAPHVQKQTNVFFYKHAHMRGTKKMMMMMKQEEGRTHTRTHKTTTRHWVADRGLGIRKNKRMPSNQGTHRRAAAEKDNKLQRSPLDFARTHMGKLTDRMASLESAPVVVVVVVRKKCCSQQI